MLSIILMPGKRFLSDSGFLILDTGYWILDSGFFDFCDAPASSFEVT
jgi:hypothetical protein